MTDENLVRFGNKQVFKLDLNKVKGEFSKEFLVGNQKFLESIFNSIDKSKDGENKPLGEKEGVLEAKELEKFINDINEAKGNDQVLSRKEAKNLLKKWNLKESVSVEALYVFLNNLSKIAENNSKDELNDAVKADIKAMTPNYAYSDSKVENSTSETAATNSNASPAPIQNFTSVKTSGKDGAVEYDEVRIFNDDKENKRYYKNGQWVGGNDGLCSYAVTSNGNKSVETWNDGKVFINEMDDKGRMVKRTRGDGRVEETRVYNDNSGEYTSTNYYGEKRTYNNKGLLMRLSDDKQYLKKLGIVMSSDKNDVFTYEYDDNNRLIKTMKNGNIYEEVSYNSEDGSYVTTSYWKGGKSPIKTTYNSHNDAVQISKGDFVLEEWNYKYDTNGNKLLRENKNNPKKIWTSYEYKPDGSYSQTESIGAKWEYDEMGRMKKYTLNKPGTNTAVENTSYKYNTDGTYTITVKNGTGKVIRTEKYDQYDNPVK